MSNTTTITKTTDQTKRIIFTALLAALTCVGTMIIKIPTPTNGYIHPGDGFVLLSGLLLGPIWGPLAAGFGSALSDLIGGYFIYVPATFIIKGLTAFVGYYVFQALHKTYIAGIIGEVIMVAGYFLFEIFMLAALNSSTISAAVIASAASIIPNLIQGIFGVLIATILYPIISKIYLSIIS